MVNLNIAIPDEIHRNARLAAALNGKTLKEYIIEALKERVRKEEKL